MTTFSMEDMTHAGCTSRRGIRYWEELGLLGEVARSAGDTRQYTAEQLDRARIIAAASFGGWKLDDIRPMLEAYHADMEVYDALTTRLTDQIRAAARLGESLPIPLVVRPHQEFELQEYDL
jgi:DNA-binding transcriptional MerR regulator